MTEHVGLAYEVCECRVVALWGYSVHAQLSPPPSPPLPVAMEMTKIVCIYNGRIYSEGCKNLTEIKRKLKENLPLSILIAISQMDFVKV